MAVKHSCDLAGGRVGASSGFVFRPMTAIKPRASQSVPKALARYLSLDDFERAARKKLPRMIYGFISGAAETSATLRGNRLQFEHIDFIPRTLVDVRARSARTVLFGKEYSAPFGIAPMGAAALCAYRGDLSLARAASAANVPMVVSASSLVPLEVIHDAHPGAWFQAYIPGDDDRIGSLVKRVSAAGYETLVVTVDLPVPANRENNVRNGFQLPIVLSPRVMWDVSTSQRWFWQCLMQTMFRHGMPHFENMEATQGPPVFSRNLARNADRRDALNWEHIALIRRLWKGPLLLKGVLSAADAKLARACGVDGLILSNHGGRQLDYTISPLKVLPEIAAEAGDMTIIVDGGIRRGSDVLKAMALGAKFVLVGRPFLFAAVAGGEPAVGRAISLLREETERNMGLLGMVRLDEIGPAHIRSSNRSGQSN